MDWPSRQEQSQVNSLSQRFLDTCVDSSLYYTHTLSANRTTRRLFPRFPAVPEDAEDDDAAASASRFSFILSKRAISRTKRANIGCHNSSGCCMKCEVRNITGENRYVRGRE